MSLAISRFSSSLEWLHKKNLKVTYSLYVIIIALWSRGILFKALFLLFVWRHNCTHTFTVKSEKIFFLFYGIRWPLFYYLHLQFTVLNNDTHLGRVISQSRDAYSGSIIPFYSEFLPFKHPQAGFEPGT